ncbi:PspC domain-containing protein [Parahaliea mediterranea]|uniref:PspC domain-containing protein n=1 Tax=Parahaliea mediterranea TaxID=651086 RepID=A0A939DGY8_9GAMM|nr:PspC domain-containing protein [Parahaliea mediterranea]MBN7798125.1 PspC domain-containing protein [Parahaliea mediterranea]
MDGTRRCRRSIRSRKKSGWGMNLYRNTRQGKIAGVAAGLADHWDVAHWVVRLLWVGAFLFTGTLALWAYIGAWILLAPRPTRRAGDADPYIDDPLDDPNLEMEYDERHHHYRPRKVFQYSEPSSVRLQRARERLNAAVQRVEDMESYVTSRQYQLNKEFSRL